MIALFLEKTQTAVIGGSPGCAARISVAGLANLLERGYEGIRFVGTPGEAEALADLILRRLCVTLPGSEGGQVGVQLDESMQKPGGRSIKDEMLGALREIFPPDFDKPAGEDAVASIRRRPDGGEGVPEGV